MLLSSALLCWVLAISQPGDSAQPSVFELPQLQARVAAQQSQLQLLVQAERYAEAEAVCHSLIKLVPHDAGSHYNLACMLARQDKVEEALTTLAKAVALGFADVKHLESDDDLAALRERPDFAKILASAATAKLDPALAWKYEAQPTAIEDGVALVSAANTTYHARIGLFAGLFKFPEPDDKGEVVKGFGAAGDLVRKWFSEGTAAGNHGDLYDNHDRDHSNMNYDSFPQLARVEFHDDAKSRVLDHGLQLAFLFNAPTIGNSSTAHVHGVFWRSQARFALMQPRGAELLYLQYANNHLYFYPEHRDHDSSRNGTGDGYGDVLPANTPYLLLSQGSSGSDRALMHAVALVMASFQPEVKAQLVKTRALMPMVQMIFRSCYVPVEKPDDYLTGKAHPSVFDGDKLDLVRLVTMAHDVSLNSLPPLVQIKMVEEDESVLGVDYFDIAPRERLFDTPCAIARVIKSTKYARRFVISAAGSPVSPARGDESDLKYHFVVLRGDHNLIAIKPLDEGRASAEIIVKHHTRRPIAEGSAMESNRVDIGVFAQSDKHYSAPAFLSLIYLDDQLRVYNAEGQIQSVDYADAETAKNYVDPMLDFKRDWRDDYRYDDAGKLVGWTRTRGEQKQQFTFDGCLVTSTDDRDRPLTASVVRYESRPQANQPAKLVQVSTEEVARYEYEGDESRGQRSKP